MAARKAASPALTSRVHGYTRVSSLAQADEGEGLDVQQRTIAGYAEMHGLEVALVAPPDRPQSAALLAALKPGDAVITPKLDRKFRSALDALDVLGRLKQAGAALI